MVQPYVDIFAVGNGQEVYSDSLSQAATQVLTGILDDNRSQFPISEFIQINDADYNLLVGQAGAELAAQGRERAKDIRRCSLPEPIRQLMTDNDLPVLMFLYESGFKRDWGDILKEAAVDAAVSVGVTVLTAILTAGTIISTPAVDSSSYATESTTITLLVADRESDSVVYYQWEEAEADPMDRTQVYDMLTRLFKYFPNRSSK